MIELDSASYMNYIFNIIDAENQFFMVFEISNFYGEIEYKKALVPILVKLPIILKLHF